MLNAKTFLSLFILFLLSCSDSDNVLNDGSRDGQNPIKITPPISSTPIDVSPAESPVDLVSESGWFNGDLPFETPTLTWTNPSEEKYTKLQIGLLNSENDWILPFRDLGKDVTNYSFILDAIEACTPHRYVIRGVLDGAAGNPAFSEEFSFDNTPPLGPIDVKLVDNSLPGISALLTWGQFVENCELASLESAISKNKNPNGIIDHGDWQPVVGNEVRRNFPNDDLQSFKKYYTLVKGIDLAGNTKIYCSDPWVPLGKLNRVTLCKGAENRRELSVNWEPPVNRNAPGRGIHQKTKIEYKLRKKGDWKVVIIDEPLTEYTFDKIAIYPCRLLHVRVSTFNGLWSEPSKVLSIVIDQPNNLANKEFYNLSSSETSKIFSTMANTEIKLNGKVIAQLGLNQSYKFNSDIGDHLVADKPVQVFTDIDNKKWLQSKDFLTEVSIENRNKLNEIDVFSLEDQIIQVKSGEGVRDIVLKSHKVATIPFDDFLSFQSEHPVLAYLIVRDQNAKIIQERLVK